MNLSLPRLRIALQLLLLFSSISFAQQYRLTPGQSAKQQPTQDLKKNLIERRFLSKSPQAQWFRDKTLAGRQVLQQRSQRSKQQRLRLQASKHARRVAQGTAPTLYPGIQFRDTLPAGVIPTSVASGDFNQDGHADFVVSNGYTSDLWIYFGKGNGTFGSPNIIPLSRGLSPVYLVAADLRGTGVLDLVIAEFDTSTVGVLLGNGDGSFGYEQTYSLPQPPVAIAVDDFNGDHKLDIVAVMFTLTTNTQQAEYIANLV